MINYDDFISEKAAQIKPSGIRKFFDIVADLKGAISLGVGEPDFLTPWNIRESAVKSIKDGDTQYTSNSGLLRLREAISQYLNRRYGLEYSANDEIIVTIGASEAIDISLRALVNPGDEILIPMPSYVSYSPCVTLCGGEAVGIECFVEDEFRVTPENLKKVITDKTKAIILPYPNNPTGGIMGREDLEKIAQIVIENNLIVISDEIYSELTYDAIHCSIASIEGMRERTIVINGFSKAFAMTGWRVGYLACPKELINAMLKIHQYIIMCAPTMSQYAACTALESGFEDDFQTVKEMHDEYDKRRRLVVKSLNDMGLKCYMPKGAFYVFPQVSSIGMDGDEFAGELLKSKKIAVVPGSAFGDCGKDFVRISYAYSIKSLRLALDKIAQFVEEVKASKKLADR